MQKKISRMSKECAKIFGQILKQAQMIVRSTPLGFGKKFHFDFCNGAKERWDTTFIMTSMSNA